MTENTTPVIRDFLLLFSAFLLLTVLPAAETAAAGKPEAAEYTVGFLAGSGGLGDESFNDMAYKGLGRAGQEYGLDIVAREWEPELSMSRLLDEILAHDPLLVILNGYQFRPLVTAYAPAHPGVFFIANDFQAPHHANVKSIIYSHHEGAFLAGALAASFTTTGRVAFLGAVDIAVIKSFLGGFRQGVRNVSNSVRIVERYISRLPDYDGFNNPALAFDKASELYDSGVDVIFSAAGLSGNGIIQAAKIKGKYAIGVDSNQDHMARGHVLTSVMKRLDTAVYTETLNVLNGRFHPGSAWYGLANGGISLTPMEYTRAIIGPDIIARIEDLKAKIITGELRVSSGPEQSD